MKKTVFMVAAMFLLGACAADQSKLDKDAQLTQDWSSDRLYSEAREQLDGQNFSRAVTLYELLRSRQPEGLYVEQSLLDEAFANYKNEEPEKALAALARFERHFPGSANMDYALYLRGLVLFAEDQSFLNKLSSQNWADRDPEANRKAYYVFNQLVTRFPKSKYADDSRKRMSQLVDALGGHEIGIARYYAKRGAFVAAANRAQRILEQYQNTRFVEEALAIMVFAYGKLEKEQLAQDTHRVLEQNFPNSPYLTKAWVADDMPWWRPWK